MTMPGSSTASASGSTGYVAICPPLSSNKAEPARLNLRVGAGVPRSRRCVTGATGANGECPHLAGTLAGMTTDASTWIAALRGSHERLRDLVEPLTPEEVAGRAYPSEWSIAQVLSHLGSGAEIFVEIVGAARAGQPVPGIDVMRPIWD